MESKSLEPKTLFLVRLVVGVVWLYEGLYMKLLTHDPHELAITRQIHGPLGLTGESLLLLIGAGETLLALVVLSGLLVRPLAALQMFLLLSMNLVGIFAGNGTIEDPAGLLVRNGPLFLCFYLLWRYGPGAYALNFPPFARTEARP